MKFKNIPQLSFCRWTSDAIRLQILYISDINPSRNLIALVHYIQQVYIPMWLRIPLCSHWDNGSRHLFALLDMSRKAAECCGHSDLLHVTKSTIINNGYFAHSENILLSMITDECEKTREIGYAFILKIRNTRVANGNQIRKFDKPKKEDYNFNASKYYKLLRHDKFEYEPPFTQLLDQPTLEAYARSNLKLTVPPFKCHSQDTERNVALMNSCISRVSGFENHNAIMRHKFNSRKANCRIEASMESPTGENDLPMGK